MTEILGLCLGPAKSEVNEMTQWILNINGQVVPRRSLSKLLPAQLSKETEIARRAAFDAAIKLIHGDSFTIPEKQFETNPIDAWDEEDLPIPVPEADAVDEKGTPINTSSLADTLITAEFVLPHGESENPARVIRQSVDKYGNIIGNYNEDPIINTGIYDVEFQERSFASY